MTPHQKNPWDKFFVLFVCCALAALINSFHIIDPRDASFGGEKVTHGWIATAYGDGLVTSSANTAHAAHTTHTTLHHITPHYTT